MAERVAAFPAPEALGSDRIRYPWEDWEDGQIWKARAGEDWPEGRGADQMRPILYMRARRNRRAGKLMDMVTTQGGVDPDGVEYVVFRFFNEATG